MRKTILSILFLYSAAFCQKGFSLADSDFIVMESVAPSAVLTDPLISLPLYLDSLVRKKILSRSEAQEIVKNIPLIPPKELKEFQKIILLKTGALHDFSGNLPGPVLTAHPKQSVPVEQINKLLLAKAKEFRN